MNLSEARRLFAYDRWANSRVATVVGELDEARRTAVLVSSYPSIIDTFAHLIGAEWVWLRRFQGESPAGFPDWLEAPSFDDLVRRLAAVEAERERLLESLGEPDLDRELAYRNLAGTPFRNRLGDLFVHVVNHSSYHRGQLTTLLRQVGATPIGTDYVQYCREEGAPA